MIRIVKQATLDGLHDQIEHWRAKAKFTIKIPYIKTDGIGEIQIHCEDKDQADKILKKLEE